MRHLLAVIIVAMIGCGAPVAELPTCARLPDDLADWAPVHGSPAATPIEKCGRVVGYEVSLKAGQSWSLKRTGVPARQGLPVNVKAEMTPSGDSVRALSIAGATRQLAYSAATGSAAVAGGVSEGGDVAFVIEVSARKQPASVTVSDVFIWFDGRPPPY